MKQEAADALGICNIFDCNFITMLCPKRLIEFWCELILQVYTEYFLLNLALICSFFIFCSINDSLSNAEENVLRRTV